MADTATQTVHQPLLGAFVGGVAPADEQNLAAMEQWLGRKLDYVVTFLNHDSWDAFDSSVQWNLDQWTNHEKLLISVPLTVTGTSLHDVASGAYDQHFVEAAQKIAAYDPNAVIRPGWEMNGNWFPWSAGASPDDYVTAYHHLVDAFRSVSPNFKFDWCVNTGSQGTDPAKVYPGDNYVDTVGLDINESTAWTAGMTPDQRWAMIMNQTNGLQWHADFAAAHGKPMSFAEYGTNIDDGTFVTHMADWIKQHDVAFQSYWNADDNISAALNEHPANEAAFKAAWGGSGDVSPTPSDTSSAPAPVPVTASDTAPAAAAEPSTPAPAPEPAPAPAPTPAASPDPAAHADAPANDAGAAPTAPVAPAAAESGPVVLHVSEDGWAGDAQFIVSVDGHQVGGVYTATASHAAGESQAIALPADAVAAGGTLPGTIAISFVNDASSGAPGQDRNLYLDHLDIGGQSYAGHAAQGGFDPGSVAGAHDPNATALLGNSTVSLDVQHLTASDYWHSPTG
ncbi:MAG TPA: carbohydrate-binding domain-containing protein [Stellaceae bacterium]